MATISPEKVQAAVKWWDQIGQDAIEYVSAISKQPETLDTAMDFIAKSYVGGWFQFILDANDEI